jgi:hypothetical protein
MNKEDIKLGTTFIITKGLDIDIINKCIKQKVEFTIVDLSSARGALPLVHCSIGNCSDQDLLDSFKKYYCEDKSSPGYGYLKISVGDLDRENMQVVYKKKESCMSNYPHICPRCGAPAYVGLFSVDCTRCK